MTDVLVVPVEKTGDPLLAALTAKGIVGVKGVLVAQSAADIHFTFNTEKGEFQTSVPIASLIESDKPITDDVFAELQNFMDTH